MGLSNEERYLRVLNTVTSLYRRLDPQDMRMWENLGTGTIDEDIAAVKDSLEQLTGRLIQQTDTNGLYWFMGEAEDSFRGLTTEFFSAESQDIRDVRFREGWGATGKKDLTLREFAFRLGFSGHFNMLNLAHWWDVWSYIPALLYAMNRYDDELFKPTFQHEVNRLISRMLQLRAGLVVDRYQEEQVMLLKYKLLNLDKHDDERPLDERLDALRAMPQDVLEDEMRKRHIAESDGKQKYHQNEKKKRLGRKFINPVHGDIPVVVDNVVEEVYVHLHDQKPYHYVKRPLILRALDLFKASPKDIAEGLHFFEEQKLVHQRRYGEENVKICDDCALKVLDQRNKTGLCLACLDLDKKRKKHAKKA